MRRVVREGSVPGRGGAQKTRSALVGLDLLPTILLPINIYNLPPSEPLFATSVLTSTPCTFWRLISRIPIHCDDAKSWPATAAERGAPGRALAFPGPRRGFEVSRRSRLDAVRFLGTRARGESLLCIRVRSWTRFVKNRQFYGCDRSIAS